MTITQVALNNMVTSTLPVGSGGTGQTALTANNVILGNGANAVAFVAPGSNGNVLTSNGTTWASVAPAGGGKVLQVVQTLKTNSFSTSSTSFVDVTGYSATITPSSATSRILTFAAWYGNNTSGGMASIWLRNSTELPVGDVTSGSRSSSSMAYNPGGSTQQPMTFIYLDSPATTSALTYKMQTRANGGSTSFFNTSPNNEIGAISTIILMEIAA